MATRLCAILHEALRDPQSARGQGPILKLLFLVWGRALLALFEHSNVYWQRKWSAFLRHLGITSASYSRSHIDAMNVCYIRLSHRIHKAYAGSTGKWGIRQDSNAETQILSAGACACRACYRVVEADPHFFPVLPNHGSCVCILPANRAVRTKGHRRKADRTQCTLRKPTHQRAEGSDKQKTFQRIVGYAVQKQVNKVDRETHQQG